MTATMKTPPTHCSPGLAESILELITDAGHPVTVLDLFEISQRTRAWSMRSIHAGVKKLHDESKIVFVPGPLRADGRGFAIALAPAGTKELLP